MEKNVLFLEKALRLCPQTPKYGIPLSRYTVFLQNCPLGYGPKESALLLFFLRGVSKLSAMDRISHPSFCAEQTIREG